MTLRYCLAKAVNLVNGVIVDGLGHVSLDSGPPAPAAQPNIHQGSIPATGRRDKPARLDPEPSWDLEPLVFS